MKVLCVCAGHLWTPGSTRAIPGHGNIILQLEHADVHDIADQVHMNRIHYTS